VSTQSKTLLLTTFLLCASTLLGRDEGQGLTMKVQVPLYQNVAKAGVAWDVGDFAVYKVYADEEMAREIGEHRIDILDLVELQGVAHFKASVSFTADGKTSSLTFHVPEDAFTCDLTKAVAMEAVTAMGRFSLSRFGSRPEETFKKEGEERVDYRGEALKAEKYTLSYSDEHPDSTLWVHADMGPYGLLKASVWMGEVYFFKLSEHGGKAKESRQSEQ